MRILPPIHGGAILTPPKIVGLEDFHASGRNFDSDSGAWFERLVGSAFGSLLVLAQKRDQRPIFISSAALQILSLSKKQAELPHKRSGNHIIAPLEAAPLTIGISVVSRPLLTIVFSRRSQPSPHPPRHSNLQKTAQARLLQPWLTDTFPSIGAPSSRPRTRSNQRSCVAAVKSSRSRSARRSARRTWLSVVASAPVRTAPVLRSVLLPTATMKTLQRSPRYVFHAMETTDSLLPCSFP